MRPVEIAITVADNEELLVSIDYHTQGAAAVKRWRADRSVVDETCSQLEDLLEEAGEMPFTDAEKSQQRKEIEERLASLGLALFQEIMKEEGDALRRWTEGPEEERHLILKIDKSLGYVPFELMHDGRAFLSHSLAIGRIIVTDQIKATPSTLGEPPFRVLVVGDPTDDPATRDDIETELAEMRKVFARCKDYALTIASGAEVDRRFLLSHLPGAAVFHFTGHGAVAERPEDTGIRLSGGKVLGGSALRGLQKPPGVVFLNMCTAAPRNAWMGSFGIVETLLTRGVRACVASLWDLASRSAALMASRFYTRLLEGETFGHALRKSRIDVANTAGLHDPTWAAYALYGDPSLSLLPEPLPAGRPRAAARIVAVVLSVLLFLAFVLFPDAVYRERIGTGGAARVGYLLVESRPEDAAVLVDGRSGIRTPGTIELPVGRHHIVIEKQDYKRWEAWVEVKESSRTDIHADLVKLRP